MTVALSSYALKMTLEYLKIVSLQYWSKGLRKKKSWVLDGEAVQTSHTNIWPLLFTLKVLESF